MCPATLMGMGYMSSLPPPPAGKDAKRRDDRPRIFGKTLYETGKIGYNPNIFKKFMEQEKTQRYTGRSG